MFFQRVLKGIPDLDPEEAEEILTRKGIQSNWFRSGPGVTAEEIAARLTDDNLMWHLSRYEDINPDTGRPFYEGTPFISTTAGTVVDDFRRRRIYVRDGFRTAAVFATRQFTVEGWIFYGYVYTLGKPSVELQEFAEEVRDFHVYTRRLKYRYEGEITAKIEIPSVRLQRAERYLGPELRQQLRERRRPFPEETIQNRGYRPPEHFANVRGSL